MTPYQQGYARAEKEISAAYEEWIAAIQRNHDDEIAAQQRAFEVTSDAVSYDRGARAAFAQVKAKIATTKLREFKSWLKQQPQ